MRHSYNTCNFSSGSKFSEYLIWFIDTPFNVDDMFDVVFHRKIPHHQLHDSLWLHISNTITKFPWFSSCPVIYIKIEHLQHGKLDKKVNKEQVILVSSDGTPDNIPLIPQNRHGTPEKSNIIGWSMMVHLKITFFHFNS